MHSVATRCISGRDMSDMGVEPTWFTVKYGEDLALPFNAECWAAALIDHIKVACPTSCLEAYP